MGQFSVEISALPGSILNGNQQLVFDWIRSQREFLLTEGIFVLGTEDNIKVCINALIEILPIETRESTRQVLAILFPSRGKSLLNREYFSQEDDADVISRRGIGCEAGYSAYFGLGSHPDYIPKQVIDGMFEHGITVDRLTAIIELYMDRHDAVGTSLVGSLFDELNARYQSSVPPPSNQQLLFAIIALGDRFASQSDEEIDSGIAPRNQALFLIQNLLDCWDIPLAGGHLRMAFERSTALGFMAEVFVDRGQELGFFKSSTLAKPSITEDDFLSIGELLSEKIETAAREHSLAQGRGLYFILKVWAHTSGPAKAKAWLAEMLPKDKECLVSVIRSFVSYSIGRKPRTYSWHGNPEPDIFDPLELASAIDHHISNTPLTDDDLSLLLTAKKGFAFFAASSQPIE